MVNPYPPQYPPQYPNPYPYPPPPRPQGNGLAVTAMVLGILALVLFWVPFLNWLLAVMGIVFGIIGMSVAKKRDGAGRGMALAGLICGVVAAVIGVVIVLLLVRAVHTVEHAVDDISKIEDARIAEMKLADEAYPEWSAQHASEACPKSLDELMPYMDAKDRKDPWGHDYKMYCGENVPEGAKGLAVSSPGPDGISGTADDIKSW